MSNFRHRGIIVRFLIALLGGAILFSPFTLPGRADEGLPPRPTLTPTIIPDDGGNERGDAGSRHLRGAHIQLQAGSLADGSWAEIQWQDRNGDWQVVDGWRGQLTGGSLNWWVHPKDFDTGPFRWVVMPAPGGEVLGVSAPFTLPGAAGQVLLVTVTAE